MNVSFRTVLAAGAPLGLAVVLTTPLAASAPARTATPAVVGGCPQQVIPLLTSRPGRMIAVTRAVKAQVPRVYEHLTSMGHRAWPGFEIDAFVVLNRLPLSFGSAPTRIRGLGKHEELAARACGTRTARASVLVFLEFPNCQLPCSFGWAYVTRTRRGWHLWTSYRA